MKRSLTFFAALLALLSRTTAQQLGYTNNSTISFITGNGNPPQIDAFNFVNNGEFDITLSGGGILTAQGVTFISTAFPQFEFSDVTNFVNRGLMTCDSGFLFDTEPSGLGVARPAASFTNSNLGTISSGSFGTFGLGGVIFAGPGLSFSSGSPIIRIFATNIVNQGLLDVGLNGFLGIDGNNVNLSRGRVHVEGFDDSNVSTSDPNIGIFNTGWGLGMQTNINTHGFIFTNLPFAETPPFQETESSGFTFTNFFFMPDAVAYANAWEINPSNFTFQVVFVNTNLAGVSTDVRFQLVGSDFSLPIIQWTAIITNTPVQAATTNFLYLSDSFGARTNFELITNSLTLSGIPQPAPINYRILRSFPGYDSLPVGNFPYTPADQTLFYQDAFGDTNQYSDYTITISPATSIPDPNLTYSAISNSPGRIAINAANTLDLTGTTLSGPNYLQLNSTNNFIGSAGALISAPFMDINLGSTNPNGMVISNLVLPSLPRFQGNVQMWSGRWTNIVNGITNCYHIWMVNPELAATSPVLLENLKLTSTNRITRTPGDIVLNDSLTVLRNCVISARSLTIATNTPGSISEAGGLDLVTANITTATFPNLRFLTNFGSLIALNFNESLPVFVNHGSSSSSGFALSSGYFENSGIGFFGNGAQIASSSGPISIESSDMILRNSSLSALGLSGDITLSAGSLTMSNELLQASGAITLAVTNQINATADGSGAYAANSWTCDDGFNLIVKPPTGDFLGTVIDDICPSGSQVTHIWAGTDLGPTTAGFSNNVAVGHLILDGNGTNCSFFFTGRSTGNALYVDQIDLQRNATNIITANQGFTALSIDSNMRIYYADAVINGGALDVSQRLDGQFGGRIRWVRDYAGLFSGTNITYPNGVTYTFNRALVSSTSIDSNGNGTVNAFDQFPFNVGPTITVSNQTASINWQAIPNSTNSVYYSASLATTNWTLLTKIVQGSAGSPVTVTDPVNNNNARYYKIQITVNTNRF